MILFCSHSYLVIFYMYYCKGFQWPDLLQPPSAARSKHASAWLYLSLNCWMTEFSSQCLYWEAREVGDGTFPASTQSRYESWPKLMGGWLGGGAWDAFEVMRDLQLFANRFAVATKRYPLLVASRPGWQCLFLSSGICIEKIYFKLLRQGGAGIWIPDRGSVR